MKHAWTPMPAFALAMVSLLLVQPARAQTSPGFDFTKLSGVCNAVYQNFKNKDPHSPAYWLYERMFYDAAGITPTREEASGELKPDDVTRIQQLWREAFARQPYGPLACDQANFDVQRGNILKYAVAMKNWDFLSEAVELWRVDLNYIDASDNRTVLDYIRKETDRYAGASGEAAVRQKLNLESFYRLLREYGAKHRSELN